MNCCENLSVGLRLDGVGLWVVWVSCPPPSGQLVEARPLSSDSYWVVRKTREFEAHDNDRFLPIGSSEFAMQNTCTGDHYPVNHCLLGRVHTLAS